MLNFALLLVSLFFVMKSADLAMKHSSKVASGLRISKYLVGFLLVAIISILPESFIAITSAIKGMPSFGLGTIFGSNFADLTLIFAIVIFFSLDGVKVESRIMRSASLYTLALACPVILGWNGYYSRLEGAILFLVGIVFYVILVKKGVPKHEHEERYLPWGNIFMLFSSIVILLVASNFVVRFGVSLAEDLRISPVLVAILLVGLSTTLPELSFSINAVKKNKDGLAMGDILGTVITDATIVIGIMAMISPFQFNPRIVYISGLFMLLASALLWYFMKVGRSLTKREALLLLIFYISFILTEFNVWPYFVR